jgi:hypothetical protein
MADPFNPYLKQQGIRSSFPNPEAAAMAAANPLRQALPNPAAAAAASVSPLTPPDLIDRPASPGFDPERSSFQAGLRSGLSGANIGIRALGANIAEAAGAPEYAKSQLREINSIKASMPTEGVQTLGQIRSLGDVADFASFSAGQAVPSIATAAGGALAARLGSRVLGLRGMTPGQQEFMGAVAGTLPQEAGQSAARMYESPEAMQRSPGERLGISLASGLGSSVLESVVPAAVVGRVARGVAPALEAGFVPAAKYIGKESLKAGGLESLTEGAQTLVGQAAMKAAAPQTESLLPSADELLTSMAAGFIPGKVMGGLGSTAEVVRSKLGGTSEPTDKFRGLIDATQNPQLNQFISSLRPPPEVTKGGQQAVAEWITSSGQIDNVLARASEIAADETLSDRIRARASDLVNSGGDPQILAEFTALATAEQRGAEVGETARRVGSASMRSIFGKRDPTQERFSAMSVPLTEDDQPLVQALTPYLRDTDQNTLQAAVPAIRDYLLASNDDPSAKMPAGLLSFFGPKKSQEGLRSAVTMMQRMGVIGDETQGKNFEGQIDDVLQRQSAWRNLISTNLDPKHGTLSRSDMNKLASNLEYLAAEATSTPQESSEYRMWGEWPARGQVQTYDAFAEALDAAFGKNAQRALSAMEGLLPQGAGSTLSGAVGMADLSGQGSEAPTLDAAEVAGAPTAAENLQAQGITEQPAPGEGVSWNFANNQTQQLYDTANPEQMGFLQSNSERLTRSGNADAVPTGVVEYARLTGDTAALQQAQEALPGATDAELNDRFKVLGVYQTGTPEAEQVRYDELVSGKSPWRSEFGSIRLFEPGKGRATLLTTPGKIIEQMRNRAPETSELQGPEGAVREFSRAVSALMNVQKNGKPAFDRLEVMNAEGKYVPLSELPDNFSIFKGVTVADARAALSQRMREQGVEPDSAPRTWSSMKLGELNLSDLREMYADMAALYRESRDMRDQWNQDYAKRRIDAVRKEVRRRLKRDGQESNNDSVQVALEGPGNPPGMLPPDDARGISAARRGAKTSGLISRFKTLDAAEEFLAQYGKGKITKQGDSFVVSDYATTTQPGELSTPLEAEEFAQGARPNVDEDELTPGDVEANREGPRLFQEDTGELLQPISRKDLGTTRSQLIKTARTIADAVRKAPASSLKSTVLKELSAATNSDVTDEVMRGRVKAAERSALMGGLISADDAKFQHLKIQGTKIAAKAKQDSDLKFTSLEPGVAEAMGEEDKAIVKEWLDKVLPKVTVEFVKDLGGMSGSYRRNDLGEALIKINVHATDHFGVAFHESLHELFTLLAEGGHQGTIDMLKRVASNSMIKRQLNKLLDGNPAAQAQLSDPEEAAAYLFQFWMYDKIQLGPQNESFFQRVVRAIKNFFGAFDDQELTSKIFTAFNDGKLRDSISRDETLNGFNTSGYDKFKQYAKPITDKLGKITDTVDARFRETNNPHLIKIIDNFNNAVGSTSEKPGYYAAVAQVRNRLINQLTETMRGYDKATLGEALEELQQERDPNLIRDPEIRGIVKEVRSTLDKLYDYMQRKGVTGQDGKPIGRVRNYFPRLWSVDALVSDGDQFVEDLLKYHKSDLDGIAATANATNAKANLPQNVDARAIAEALLAKLTRNNGVMDKATLSKETALKEMEDVLGFSPAMLAANERVLNFLDMKVFSKYLQKDLVFAMTQYINQAVKRAEYSDRFGSNGEKLQDMMSAAEQYEVEKRMKADPQLARSDVENKVKEDYKTYRTGVMALEGTLGHDISPELRKFNSAMMTYQNIRTIPLALLSSFVDPLGIVVRGGEMKQAYKAFTRGMSEVMKSWKGEVSGAEDPDVALAEMLGTLEPSSYLDSLGQTYGSMFMTGKARQINDFFFRLNGMEGWNRAMRTQATIAAIDFIKKLKTSPDKNTDRYLQELGLTADDIVIKEDGTLDFSAEDKRLQSAVMRWVDGAILRPNAAQRPAWASNPKYALLFHLNQFTYSFHKVILERMYNEAKKGNYDPLMVAAAGYVPVMLASNIIRAFIQGGGEEPDWMKGESIIDWIKRAVQGAGLTGVPGAISDKLPYGVAGPTVQQALDAVFEDKDLTTTIEKSLPLQAIYRHW